MLITSKALYTGIRAEIHIINRCITPVANSFVVEKVVGGSIIPFYQQSHPSGILLPCHPSPVTSSATPPLPADSTP